METQQTNEVDNFAEEAREGRVERAVRFEVMLRLDRAASLPAQGDRLDAVRELLCLVLQHCGNPRALYHALCDDGGDEPAPEVA